MAIKKENAGNSKLVTIRLQLLALRTIHDYGYYVSNGWRDVKPVICPFRSFIHPRNTNCYTEYIDGTDYITVICRSCNVLPFLECELRDKTTYGNGSFERVPAAKCPRRAGEVPYSYPDACRITIKLNTITPRGIPLKLHAGGLPFEVSPWIWRNVYITVPDVRFYPRCTDRTQYDYNKLGADWLETTCTCYIPNAQSGDHVQWLENGLPVHHNTPAIIVRMMINDNHRNKYECLGHTKITERYPGVAVPRKRELIIPYDIRPSISLDTSTCPENVTYGQVVDCHCVLDEVGRPPHTPQWFDSGGKELHSVLRREDDSRNFFANLTFPLTRNDSAPTGMWTCKAVSVQDTYKPGYDMTYKIEVKETDIYTKSLARGTTVVVMLMITLATALVCGAWLHYRSAKESWDRSTVEERRFSSVSSASSDDRFILQYRRMSPFRKPFQFN